MSYINREEAIRLIMEYQGGAMDKPTARKVLEGMDGIEICEDTISRQAAIDGFYEMASDMDHLCTVSDYISFLKSLSAQPEIIRCKDCKHYEIWQLKSDYTDDKRYKPSVCVVGRYAVHRSEDWFCADAERRTDD